MKVKVSKAEYAEFKRLTQKVNRRIKAHQQAYAKAGHKVIPLELTKMLGGIQHKSQYQAGELTPLSRGLGQFKSKKEFDQRLKLLSQMADNQKSVHYMPTVKEYTQINRSKLLQALDTAGIDLVPDKLKELMKMDSAAISDFWKEFGERATRKAMNYSSDAVFMEMFSGNELQPFVEKRLS